jgi:hypothetical protein
MVKKVGLNVDNSLGPYPPHFSSHLLAPLESLDRAMLEKRSEHHRALPLLFLPG